MKKTITNKLVELKGQKALVPYLTCGFPNLKRFEKLAEIVCESGADMIEIGLPFSDPLADGKSIQHSSRTALNNGYTLKKGFNSISRVAAKTDIPIIIMTYLNIVLAEGESNFLRNCSNAGSSGLVIPDLPADHSYEIAGLCESHFIDLIQLIAPTTPDRRIGKIARRSKGFVYLVSIKGTTGKRDKFPSGTISFIRRAKKISPIPVLVGFGVSNTIMARKASRYSDGVIIGSALIEIIRSNGNPDITSRKLRSFLRSIKKEMNS